MPDWGQPGCSGCGSAATSWRPGPASRPSRRSRSPGALGPLADYVVAVRAPAFDQFGAPARRAHGSPASLWPWPPSLRRALPGRVAVVAQGSIVDADMAESVVAGAADLVEMTRAQIADPDLAAKLAAARPTRSGPACCATSAARSATPATPS